MKKWELLNRLLPDLPVKITHLRQDNSTVIDFLLVGSKFMDKAMRYYIRACI